MHVANLHRYLTSVLICCFLSACSTATPTVPASGSATPTAAEPAGISTEVAIETAQPTSEPTDEVAENDEQSMLHLWALRGNIDAVDLVNYATGAPEDDDDCGTAMIAGDNSQAGEVTLALSYAPSIIPKQVNLWLDGSVDEILRVEILNTTSGLGREVYPATSATEETLLDDNACSRIMTLPIDVDFEVDTVFITFRSLAAAGQVDAAELVGSTDQFIDAPVYWRMPLAAAPVSVAVDRYNKVVVAAENNNIYEFDIEGNELGEAQVILDGSLSDLTFDNDNNLVLSDAVYGTYSIVLPNGEVMIGGGDSPAVQVAIEPDNGKLFLLGDLGGLFYLFPYLPGTDEIINPLPLDDVAYTGLAFSPDNRLYTIRPIEGFLAEHDPLTGLEIYSIPLKTADYIDSLPVDLSIDQTGTFYVLFERNEGNSAIAVLDANGAMLRRAGTLSEPVDGDWPEGSYYQPRSIAVTADGRFALIVDGEAGTYYLTCLFMKAD